jgi:hypothetical protein
MDMPGDLVEFPMAIRQPLQVMYKKKRPPLVGLLMYDEFQSLIGTHREYVVVAPHQVYLTCRYGRTPLAEKFMFQVLMAVEEVAGDDECVGFEILDLLHEPVEILLIDLSGYGYPRSAEMARFAEVEIRDDERFLLFPEKATFRGKPATLRPDLQG